MVRIERGVSSEGSRLDVYLEILGLRVNIRIVNDKILFVDSSLNVYNLPTMGDIEKFCSKIRGYYGHADKFNELKEWYDDAINNQRTDRHDSVEVDEAMTMPMPVSPDRDDGEADISETNHERRTRRLRERRTLRVDDIFGTSGTSLHGVDVARHEDITHTMPTSEEYYSV